MFLLALTPSVVPVGESVAPASASVESCTVGASSACPATSPQEIFNLYGTQTNGTYWLRVGGVATQVYLVMDQSAAWGGGNWVLLMKGTQGSDRFRYADTLFTSSSSTLNSTSLTNDVAVDAKFSVYNNLVVDELLAVFMSPQFGTINAQGDIQNNNFGGHTWRENVSSSPKTAQRQLTTTRTINGDTRDSIPNVKYYQTSTRDNQVFSYQTGRGRYGFGVEACSNSDYDVRWGIAWNNEPDFNSCDVAVGIGLGGYASGDHAKWYGAGASGTTFPSVTPAVDGGKGNFGFQIWGKMASPSLASPAAIVPSTLSATEVKLSWSAVSGATDYVLQYKTTAGSTWSETRVVTGTTTATIAGLSSATSYDYRVFARTAQNSSSTPTALSTFTANPISGASAVRGDTQATVSWTAPSSGTVSGYTVTSTPGSFTCTTTETSCAVTGLTNGTSYSFEVVATFSGSSATSVAQTASVVPAGQPGQVTNLSTTAGEEEVTLSWDAPSANGSAITGYTIEYADNSSFTSSTNVSSATTSATISALTNGTRYYFRVSATNGAGTGTSSSVVMTRPVSGSDYALDTQGDAYASGDAVAVIPATSSSDFTVEMWVKLESISGGAILLSQGDGADTYYLKRSGASLIVEQNATEVDSGYDLPVGEWVHIGHSVDASDTSTGSKVFVNGQLVKAFSGSRKGYPTVDNDHGFHIGALSRTNGEVTDGQFDQVKVWSAALTQEQIEDSMHAWDDTAVTGSPTLVSHYDFNDNSQSTVLRDMRGSNDLIIASASTSDFTAVAETSTVAGDRVVVFPRSYLTGLGGWTVPAAASTYEYLVVGGGASGGRGQCGVYWGHGGGGGGVAIGSGTGLSGVKAVTVGTGGIAGTLPCNSSTSSGQGTNGSSSVFNAITATGGSAGIYNQRAGGSSGLPTSASSSSANLGGTIAGANWTSCVANDCFAGSGGGAGGAGVGTAAGPGRSSSITGTSVVYGSGGVGVRGGVHGTPASGGGSSANPNGTTPGSGGSDAHGTSFSSTITWGSGANGIVVLRYEVLAVPTISSHPANTTIQSGANGSLSVTASPAASYQWQVSTNGGNTWANVSSATSSTLSLTAVTTSMNNNQYRVIVTNSNDGGETTTATSNAAILTVEDGVTVTGAVCDGSYTKNGLTVDAGHGTVFYIDTGQGQEIDAGYIAYIVESANARNDLWVEVTNFSGGVVSLANVNASTLPLGAITAGGSDTAFFMIKASGATTTAQSHIVNVYSQKPTIGNPQPLYSCGYTFVEVAETIKAAANKVESITSTTATRIGSTMTITVQGDSGTIGQGNDIDGRMIWVTPAARSDWPTDALRLESTSITLFSDRNRRTQISSHTDTLRVNASTGLQSNNRQYYTATYTFRIIGSAASTAPIIPIAMISSGTQVKHTDVGSLPTGGTSVVDLRSPTIDLTVTKNVNPSTVVNSDGTTTLSYTITLTNGGSDTLIIDEVIDTPDTALSFKTGTARFNGAAINDPGATGASSVAFSGPLTLPANSARTITYDMSVRTCSVGSTYSFDNIATARTGTVVIGSGSATQSAVNIAGNCGQPTATVTVTNVLVDPVPVTSAASSVTTTTATISGTVDPNSQSGLDVRFRYSTNPNLSWPTDVALADTTIADAPYGVSTNLTGLSGGTTYYYVLDIEDPDGGWISGTTRSFITDPVPSQVSVTTTSPTSLSTTSAVLNGTVDADGVTGGAKVKFEWAESASSSSCSTLSNNQFTGFLQSEDGSGGTEDAILTGFSGVPMSYELSGLTANTNYCYQVVAYSGSTYSSPTTGSPGWVVFTSTSKTTQTISWSTSSNPLSAGGTTTVTATATSNLPVTYTSADTNVCTVDSDGDVSAVANSGTCSITATQAGDSTYYAAIPVTTTFAIIPPVVTPATLVAGTYQTSGYTQTLRATGGDGTYGTWAVSSGSLPGGLTLNSSTGVISGTPTAAGVFTFSVTTVSNSVTSAAQPFTISIAKRVVTVTASSPSVVFGGAAPSVSPVYSGFIGSDQTTVSTSPNVAPSCTSTYVVGQNAGTSATTSCSGGTHANYTYTYATGTVTVTKFPVTITAIDAAKQNIVSGVGGINTEVTADPTLRWTATSPLPAGQTMADVVPGGVSIARASAGTALGVVATASLPAGEQAGSFVITPAGTAGANYEVTYVNGSFTIQTPKEVPSLVVTNKTMTYGDSNTASPFIAGAASNRANGSVDGTFVYTYVDGDGVTQTLTSLSGLGAGTYLVSVKFTPTDSTAYYHDADSPLTETMVLTIERKSVIVTAADKKKLVGALDPALTWSGTGYLGSDADADLAPVTITRGAGETEGSYAITTTGGSTPNYVVTHVPGNFYIYEPVITVSERAGVLTNRTVQANCRGLKPGTTANFILETAGTPNTIATTTVANDGTCPMSSTLATTVPQGIHTLRLAGKDPLDGDVSRERTIILLSDRIQVITNNNGGGGSGGGGNSPGGAPPLLSTPLSLVTGQPGVRRPIVPPGLAVPPATAQTPPATTETPSGPATRLVPTLPGAPRGATPGLPGGANATLDLGSGVVSSDQPAGGSNGGASSSGEGVRSVQELASERLGGFAPGVATRIEVLGARTGARFVVTEASQVDTFTLIRAIQTSIPAQSADFFALDDVRPAVAPQIPPVWVDEERAGITEFFAASGLPAPVSLADLDTSGFDEWIQVTGSAETYLPGSLVYLTLTSEPLVLASAEVARDGSVLVTGSLPVEWLSAGEHRVRLVGIRSLDGVSVDDQGEVQLSNELMAEIQRFDLGTQSTIAVMGSNLTGGDHVALRVVPLVPEAPWWTLWFILLGFLLVVLARWRGLLRTRGRHLIGSLVVLASAAPAVILGWLSTVTSVVWWALGLGLIASALSWFAPESKKARRAKD